MEFDSLMPQVMSSPYFQSPNQLAKESGYDGHLLCHCSNKAIAFRLSVDFSFFHPSFLILFPKKQDLCDCALCLCLYLTVFAWRAVSYQVSVMEGEIPSKFVKGVAEQSAAAEKVASSKP